MDKDLVCLPYAETGDDSSRAPALLANRSARSDDLYFVRVKGGPCKIGRSGNVPARFRMYVTHCPDPVELIGVAPQLGPMEKVWHRAFASQRHRGEWFAWSHDLGRAIAAAVAGEEWIPELDPPPHYVNEAKREWRACPELANFYRSPWRRAAHRWCEHIADYEEDVLAKLEFRPSFSENCAPRDVAESVRVENFSARSAGRVG